MAKFKGAILKCQACGAEYKVPSCRAKKSKFCSLRCSEKHRLDGLKVDLVEKACIACGESFWDYPSKVKTRLYCSKECIYGHADYLKRLSERTLGTGNGMWSGGQTNHSDGYLYERVVGAETSRGYVLQHRLVVEEWLLAHQPESSYLVDVEGQKVLNPKLVVHHKNLDRKDNRIENLQVMTISAHNKLHAALRRQQKVNPLGPCTEPEILR